MKNRIFIFLLTIVTVFVVIGWAAYGGDGWPLLGWLAFLVLTAWWGGSQAIRLMSPKAIGYGFASSIGPDANYRELDEKTAPPKPGAAKGDVIWPRSRLWAIGGGLGLGLTIPSSGEFIIAREGTFIETNPSPTGKSNVFFNGYAHEITRPTDIKYRFWGTIRPHIVDKRLWFPEDWVEILTHHPQWDWQTSKVWVIDVPVHPFIRINDVGEFMIHGVDGKDAFPLKDLIPGIERLRPDTVFLDLLHRISNTIATENAALRASAASADLAERARSKKYAQMVSDITDVEDRARGGLFQQVGEYVTVDEDSQGAPRQ